MECSEHLATVAYYKSLDRTSSIVTTFHPSIEFCIKIVEQKQRGRKKENMRKNGHEYILEITIFQGKKVVSVENIIDNR